MSEVSYYMDAKEWDGLDSTGKEDCAMKALATIERWQKWKKNRKEFIAVRDMSEKERMAITLGEEDLFKREVKAGIFDSNLEIVLEALHIQSEELLPFCNVRLSKLVPWATKRWLMEPAEAAYALRKSLPLFKHQENSKPATT
jgi:hypothetical protein